ncbi:4'-demethylrebeccamycin synthase [Flavobacterium bizetiae]|uniref:4'-demethylrebeccamycin synthase n=1 Tax=Flavobacterium bizetiae TaxID=2704140 RepID=A0A6J4GLM2_9FLAO|nr:macrolide family glycosyltransferase [Flavobacterium bizetiae]CAA9200096.1 4'-demethylrebeccamycin synthase [Flavobacterium bizetiae]CAD5343450.1 4'-demethylrebeccamycin synthase [Flavobacterium bizetiae]CAD5349443.1 4'-demethylrebeccamycin synthase [Flavobacterium bizetiae]
MSKVLFLSIPSHGHMNPMMGLANELVNQGEEVLFFSSEEFKKPIQELGAEFKCYKEDLNIFQKKEEKPVEDASKKKSLTGLASALLHPEVFIDAILEEIQGLQFDYIVFSAAYPYAKLISQILQIPSVSSYAVFATKEDLFNKKASPGNEPPKKGPFGLSPEIMKEFQTVRENLIEKYKIKLPENMMDLFFNKGDLNIVYTSKYFIKNINNYDESFLFIGPPIYNKKYNVDFPFDKIEGKKVVYISLGTIFSNHSKDLNNLFFDAFANTDYVVVMAAHKVNLDQYKIPANFIIRDYVPQLEILKHTNVAITHAGMNSMGDLVYNKVPFVSIPLGADQFFLANRAEELGATIVLDVNTLTSESIKNTVEKVNTESSYAENIAKISNSFIEAGGYKKAVEEIFRLKSK